MFAIGRRPNVMGLGLETLQMKIHEHGGIDVDEYSRSSVPNIYAVGDVTNRVNLTPVAIREGHAFADTVYGGKPTPVDHTNVPTAVFSEPEVGVIGLTEHQAREQLAIVDVYKTSFRPMKATLSGRNTRSFMKLLVDGNDRPRGRLPYRRPRRGRIDPGHRSCREEWARPRRILTRRWRFIRRLPRNWSPCARRP